MIKIYHAPRTRGFRLIWTCEELGVPYNVEHVPFTPEFRFSDEFLRRAHWESFHSWKMVNGHV